MESKHLSSIDEGPRPGTHADHAVAAERVHHVAAPTHPCDCGCEPSAAPKSAFCPGDGPLGHRRRSQKECGLLGGEAQRHRPCKLRKSGTKKTVAHPAVAWINTSPDKLNQIESGRPVAGDTHASPSPGPPPSPKIESDRPKIPQDRQHDGLERGEPLLLRRQTRHLQLGCRSRREHPSDHRFGGSSKL